jgi:hypothetical protein
MRRIPTHNWSNADMIAELKAQLARRKPVIFLSGGHYMLIVGYDATGPDRSRDHWILLDSRGTARHPQCLLEQSMDMNYDSQVPGEPGRYHFTFEIIDRLELALPPAAPPDPVIAPGSADLRVGDRLELVANVGGMPPVTYQWLRNGEVLPGQTGSILQRPSVSVADRGLYAVRVTNGVGSAVSPGVPVAVAEGPGPVQVTVTPPAASMGAGCTRTFLARVTGGADGRVAWRLAGPGRLRNPAENPVVFTADATAGTPLLTVCVAGDRNCQATVPITVKSLDFNGDGAVDVLDLAVLAQAYGARRGDAHYLDAADLNGDGRVGADDAMDFLEQLDGLP